MIENAPVEQQKATSSLGGDSPAVQEQQQVDGRALLALMKAGGAWLERHVAHVNALNVFPVPDGDTGTNMSLTMRAALQEVGDRVQGSVSELAHAVAHGALMGARGNSGVILSQILRGMARALDNRQLFTAAELAEALHQGAVTAYKGVLKPVEGTILTVAREASDAAKRAVAGGADFLETLTAAVAEAQASLARTPSLLPVLAEAGVVDAGGQGYVLILEGFLRHLRGESIDVASLTEARVQHGHIEESPYGYDTQFIIEGNDLDVEAIRQVISSMGDSVLVVGDGHAVKVHVHSDHPGRVLDYGIAQGHLTNVIIENMQLQYEEFRAAHGQASEAQVVPKTPLAASSPGSPDIAVIAVVSGDGLKRVFESLGVDALVSGGQTMNPSTQDLLTAIESVDRDQVILLPNNTNIILAARQAQELSRKQVRVVPTKTIPQGIAALLAFNYQADLDANVNTMEQAGHQVQTGEITRAVRSVQVNGLAIAEGQIIGLVNDALLTVGEDITWVAMDLLARMNAGDCEIVTIYHGEGVSAEDAHRLAGHAKESYPDLELEVLDGGQPHYHYIISVE